MTVPHNRIAENHSWLYWFGKHSLERLEMMGLRHRLWFGVSLTVALGLVLFFRADVQPYVLWVRTHIALFVALVGAGVGLWRLVRKRSWVSRFVVSVVSLLMAGTLVAWGDEMHTYIALWYRYKTLPIVELDDLPLTGYERIQPLNSVFSLAHEAMMDSEAPTLPSLVRIGRDYRWTLAVEPAYPIPRTFNGVEEVFNVSATAPSPNFSRENRIPVGFDCGEHLLFGRNIKRCVIRRFGIWRYLNYEPSDVRYLMDDRGELVQVVSLIRWRGFIFPRPEFGGVHVIRQRRPGMLRDALASIERVLIGSGAWLRPEDIPKHPYLVGQNILAHTVSRYGAESFRFQNGFLAPFPWYHRGDIRIADLPADVNDQPFTTYFVLPGKKEGALFHYFCLEPYDPDKQGLNTSVFFPADGSRVVYVYKHHERGDALVGVSTVARKVMESRKIYDWRRNRPAEHRPYIKSMGGKKRFFWMTTVVTFGEEHEKRFIAGTVPEVVLTDAAYGTPIWVNPLAPDTWLEQVERELAAVWRN